MPDNAIQDMENISKTIMTDKMDRRAAEKIFGRKANWGETSRLAEKLGVQICSLSNWLHGRGGLSADKVEAVFQRAQELEYKNRARLLFNRAIAKGEIVRPEYCESCGIGGRLNGHHEDYTKPLEVIWLCGGCHQSLHALKNRMTEIEQKASAFHPKD